MNTVSAGMVVSLHYTLTDSSGEVLDASEEGQPLVYLHGSGSILPGLERQLDGRMPGMPLNFELPPQEAYGERDPRGVQRVPRSAFPEGAELEAGMELAAEGPDGEPVPVWVKEVGPFEVTVDFNHPLAGMTLKFAVTIADVREATSEEKQHGHPHGAHGHQH